MSGRRQAEAVGEAVFHGAFRLEKPLAVVGTHEIPGVLLFGRDDVAHFAIIVLLGE